MNLYRIGRIGKPHGIHGEVQMWVDDDVFDRIESPYIFIEVDGLPVPFFFEEYRFRGEQSVLARFDGIDSEEKARQLTGCDVLFERDKANDADEDALGCEGFAIPHQSGCEGFAIPRLPVLVGYTIINTAAQPSVGADASKRRETIGIIRRINDTTINTLFEVETADGQLVYIPVAEEWITDINPKQLTISMQLPEGLLEINL